VDGRVGIPAIARGSCNFLLRRKTLRRRLSAGRTPTRRSSTTKVLSYQEFPFVGIEWFHASAGADVLSANRHCRRVRGANEMTATTSAPSVTEWARSFTEATNNDPEIQAHGKYFTCSYMLDMGEHTFIVEVVSGKVVNVGADPGPLDVPYEFLVRASAETWRNFGTDVPAPMYHGIWAATFRRDMKLEGDILVLMQNLRCFTRQIELLRTTGVPV
jgi:hypothetical protein